MFWLILSVLAINSYSYKEVHCDNCCWAEKSSKYPDLQDLMKFNKTLILFVPRWLYTISYPTYIQRIILSMNINARR